MVIGGSDRYLLSYGLAKALAVVLAISLPGVAQADCAGKQEACSVASGTYHIVLPEKKGSDLLPAVIFLHGWGADGASVMRNELMIKTATDRGFAVIAPDGSPRQGRKGRSWHFHPNDRGGRDEGAFLRSVADQAAAKFGLDRERILLGGFSIGGSMVSYVACEMPGSFAAYAPVGGNFWEPLPESCKGPVRLYHTHGWADGTVPLEGRRIGMGEMEQGDVFAAMKIWRAANGCEGDNPTGTGKPQGFMTRSWDCTPGSALTFALHPGGHSVPKGWAKMALDWFEGVTP